MKALIIFFLIVIISPVVLGQGTTHTSPTGDIDFECNNSNEYPSETHYINVPGATHIKINYDLEAYDGGGTYITVSNIVAGYYYDDNLYAPDGFGTYDYKYVSITVPNDCVFYLDLFGKSSISISYQGIIDAIGFSYDAAGNRTDRFIISEFMTAPSTKSTMRGIDESQIPNNPTEKLLNGSNLKIYPNPTQGELKLEFINFPENERVKLQLFDITGKKLKAGKINTPYYLLDMYDYPTGTYMLKLQTSSEQKIYQIVKD